MSILGDHLQITYARKWEGEWWLHTQCVPGEEGVGYCIWPGFLFALLAYMFVIASGFW